MKKSTLENLSFPLEFFEDEVREGFLVSAMVKRYWAAQLKVLSYIAKICDKYDIKWFADCGTLLGAVRHEGFIPWDDDLDICMLRSDWEKFFAVAVKELPEEFVVMNIEQQPEYFEIIGRIVNRHSINYSASYLKEWYGCPYTVGVDIFPLDNMYDDEEKEKDRMARAAKALDFYNKRGTRNSVLEAEKIYKECPDEKSSRVTLMPVHVTYKDHIYPKELFSSYVELPFENTYIRVPARYEEVLSIEYHDYMKVVKAGGVHEYPVYTDQEEILRDRIGHNPFRYTFDSRELLSAVGRYVLKMTAPQTVSEHKKALFLPCRAKWWNSMEGLWEEMQSDGIEVQVAPIPFSYRDFDGRVLDEQYEKDLFPDYVHALEIEKVDFIANKFDYIVIQVPYDAYGMSLTVPEFYYSSNLIKHTDELIYLPFFDADDPGEKGDKAGKALSIMVEQPAVINADKVILKTDRMKDLYMKKLVEFSGEETRNYWNQKLVVKNSVKAGYREKNTNTGALDWWNDFTADHSGKKVMVYYITISFLLKGRNKSIEKIRDSIRVFNENSDKVTVIILPQDLIETELPKIDAEMWERYKNLVNDITALKNCIYDKEGKSLDFIDRWDGLYGDTGSIARKCAERQIPVMIQNLDVLVTL